MKRVGAPACLLALVLVACSGPILANPALAPVAPPTPTPAPTRAPDPQPIVFPRDDGPHDRLTEWWYYTGHLRDVAGGRWGFEFVIFRAERGGLPVSWASHLALTDEAAGTFRYAQRSMIGPNVDIADLVDVDPVGFALDMPAFDPANPASPGGPDWRMVGSPRGDRLTAALTPTEADATGGAFGFDLGLVPAKAPALHGGNGWLDFGPAGGSYYYSRTSMAVVGTLNVSGERRDVEGLAWFDHQWGDFISVGAGGWDWFAVNLDDGTDLTISLVRAADGSYPLVYGTLVDAAGRTTNLDRTAFEVEADPTRTWTSLTTGATYPAGWTITVPSADLVIDLEPTVAAQELDTRATTGVVYWEGSQVVRATRDGEALGGQAYVELTGYAPAVP